MKNCGVAIEGADFDGQWMIIDVLDKFNEKQYLDVAETMLTDFEKFKYPTEIKSSILKACGLHVKDLIGISAYLVNARTPIAKLSEHDLDDYARWNTDMMSTAREMEECQKEDSAEI